MAMPKCAANYAPLTPITFLERTAALHGDRTSIVYGDLRWTWAQTMERCRRLASRIAQLVSVGETVTFLLVTFATHHSFSHILGFMIHDLGF